MSSAVIKRVSMPEIRDETGAVTFPWPHMFVNRTCDNAGWSAVIVFALFLQLRD